MSRNAIHGFGQGGEEGILSSGVTLYMPLKKGDGFSIAGKGQMGGSFGR